MPTQADTQSWIQAFTPSAVNNGNPNTIYNSPATPMNSVPRAVNPAWASGLPTIPMSTATGQWMLPQIQSANPANTGWVAPPVTPIQTPVWNIQTFGNGGSGGGTGGGTNPPPTGGPYPPVPTGGGGGGGGTAPDPTGTPPTGTTVFGDGGPFNQSFSIYDPVYKSVWGNRDGNPGVDQATLNKFFGNLSEGGLADIMELRQSDGSLDWAQLIDMVTEPWFQTNMYLSGLNSWDTSNILAGIAQAITGLPWNNLMQKLGEQQAFQNDPQNALERMLVDHWRDNVSNDVANYTKRLGEVWNQVAGGGSTNNQQALYNFYNSMFGGRLNNAQFGSNDPRAAWGIESIAGVGCVTLDSYIKDFGFARDVKVGDELTVVDPITFEESKAVVSYSEAKLQPVVRLTTKGGIVLECSRSAPISDDTGEQVNAEDLLGVSVPLLVGGEEIFDTVMQVEDLGDVMVQHITCENKFFLAGKEKGKYYLHHNTKYDGSPLTHKATGGLGGMWNFGNNVDNFASGGGGTSSSDGSTGFGTAGTWSNFGF